MARTNEISISDSLHDLTKNLWLNPKDDLALRILLLGLATGRIDVGVNETLEQVCERITGRDYLFGRKDDLRAYECMDLMSQVKWAIGDLGEEETWNLLLWDKVDAYAKEKGMFIGGGYPTAILRTIAIWGTSPSAKVFSLGFNALPALLAEKGKQVTIWTQGGTDMLLWQLFKQCSGIPIDIEEYNWFEVEKSRTPIKATTDADLYLLLPWMTKGTKGFEKTDMALIWLKNALKVANGKILTTLAPGYTFNETQQFLEFRRQAVQSQRLYAVAELPDNLCDATVLSSMLFLFDRSDCSHSSVTMVDLKKESYFSRPMRRRQRVITQEGQDAVQKIIQFSPEGLDYRDVLNEEIAAANYSLLPCKYLIDERQAEHIRQIGAFKSKLTDFVEVIRPIPINECEKGEQYHEVCAADISEFGRVSQPSTCTMVEMEKQTLAFKRTILQPGDIVFVVKGSVGKCGIVGDNAPKNWVLGQPCVGLRLRAEVQKSFVYPLVRYLRSSDFKEYLKSIVPSLQVPNRLAFMSVKQVENFPIPSWTQEQIETEVKVFEEQECLLKEQARIAEALQKAELSEIPSNWN
jgi:hypothetical protein